MTAVGMGSAMPAGTSHEVGAIVAASDPHSSWSFGATGSSNNGLVAASSTGDFIVSVSLTFQGRRKLLRHSGNTRVGQILELHPSLLQRAGQPLVIVDAQGFEVGKEITLGTLCSKPGAILELEVQADEW
jgi:hypothetical protein